MKAIALSLTMILAASVAQAQTSTLWATTFEHCNRKSKTPGDWITISDMGIRGYDFKCTFMNKQGDNFNYTVSSICGMENSDVIFKDVFSIQHDNVLMIIKYDNTEKTFYRCKP